MRAFGIAGLAVTMPHKDDVAAAVDLLDPAAAALRTANTVVLQPDGRLAGLALGRGGPSRAARGGRAHARAPLLPVQSAA